MHEEDVRNVPAVQRVREVAVKNYALVRRLQVSLFESGNRGAIALCPTAGIWLIPLIVAETHGYGGNLVATLQQKRPDCASFFGRISLGEKWVTEPLPVFSLHLLAQQRLVATDIGFKLLGGVLVQIHVRPGMIAQRIACSVPGLQNGSVPGLLLDSLTVDKAIDLRRMSFAQGRDDFGSDFEASFPGRQRPMSRKIVERDRHLRVCGSC